MYATTHRQAHQIELAARRVAVTELAVSLVAWTDGIARAKIAAEASSHHVWRTAPGTSTGMRGPASVARSGECGGDLPPCCVLARESGGDPRAENPVSTASGLWQFVDGTWGGYGGYSHASYAPVSVQNDRARQVWAGGAGASNWYPRCW